MTPLITFAEAPGLLAQLEPRCTPPTYWQLRDLNHVLAVVDADCVVNAGRVRNLLLNPLDVMLLRLWSRMTSESAQPAWVVGAVLAHHRIELRDIFSRREDRVLVFRGLRSLILSPDAATNVNGEVYALKDIPVGVVAAMRAVRHQEPCVWDGGRNARPSEISTVPSSLAAPLCEVAG